MTILLLKGYNNYFNRIVKQESSITAYKQASTSYLEYPNVNFDPQDGIMTSLVVGSEVQRDIKMVWPAVLVNEVLKFDDLGSPDYLIVHNNTNIVSRWFVTECVKIRQGQYKLALKRDVLVDFNENILEAPCFVEKGTISAVTNPLLFNAEGMKFNEIKKDELLIKDETKCAWLVGYVKKDITEAVTGITYTNPSDMADIIGDISDLPFTANCIEFRDSEGNVEQPALKKAINIDDSNSRVKMRLGHSGAVNSNERISMTFNADKAENYRDYNVTWQNLNSAAMIMSNGTIVPISANAMYAIGEDVINRCKSDGTYLGPSYRFANLKHDAITKPGNIEEVTDEQLIDLFTSSDAVRYILYDNKTYKLLFNLISYSKDEYFTGNDTVANDLLTSLEKNYTQYSVNLYRNTSNPGNRKIKVEVRGTEIRVVAQEVTSGVSVSYTFPTSSSRAQVSDAQYNMFAMPVMPDILGINPDIGEDVKIRYDDEADELDIRSISIYQLGMANAIMTKLGGSGSASKAYDLQLLPYCPFNLSSYEASYPTRRVIDLDEAALIQDFDYDIILDGNENAKGIIFFARNANFTKDIALPEMSPNEQISLRNMEVREEVQVISNPTFTYNNGDYQGLPLFRMELPYKVIDEHLTMDAVTLPSEITDGLVNSFISPVYTEGVKPAIYFTNSNMVGPYDPSQKITFTDAEIQVLAHWILPDNALALKVENECDFQRLVSPNYNGMFQFKKARMNNGVSLVNIDCTYKPYSPYIKLNPNFSFLYGKDWNDSTGLICVGDFSIPMINDPFINYALQNKNYQAIFSRQIENLDVNQQIAREQQQFQGIVSTITGGVGGAGAGALASKSPYGAAIGAAIGTTLSGVGFAKDREWLEQQQAEVRDFAIDQFQYQLGNIQALPQSISKSSPLSFNNKVWPILEFFSCTDEEKNVLKDKIKYNGMTIMAIGRLTDYMIPGGYLKGKLIRLNDLNDDSHIANAIYEEVDKGFYEGE